MHSIRSTLHPGEPVNEPNFNTGEAYFNKLHNSVVKLQQAATDFSQHMRPILQAAHSFTDEVELLFNQDRDFHASNALVVTLRTRHDATVSNLVLNGLIEQLNTSVIQKLTNELQRYRVLSDRIQDHAKTKQDKEYYATKIEKLLSAREQAISSGKTESASKQEKWERNQDKLLEADSVNEESLNSLVDEFHHLWIHRQDVLGPIVLSFLRIEQQFVDIFETAKTDLPNPNLPESHKSCDEAEHKTSQGLSVLETEPPAVAIIPTEYKIQDSTKVANSQFAAIASAQED